MAPRDSSEVPDEIGARLIVLGPTYPHAQAGDGGAKAAADEILDRRWASAPHLSQQPAVLGAGSRRRLDELEQAVGLWMAWASILDEEEPLQLTPFQKRQADAKVQDWNGTVEARIKETWIWAMAPHQPEPTKPEIEWSIEKVSGTEALAVRAGKKFVADGALYEQLGARNLRQAMDKFDLWRRADHVLVKQVSADFACYLYLPRLSDRKLLANAVQAGISQLVCDQLAYAEAYDTDAGRYVGVHTTSAGTVPILFDETAVIVKPDAANAQLKREGNTLLAPEDEAKETKGGVKDDDHTRLNGTFRRFYGSFEFRPDRLVREAGSVSTEVLDHLARLNGAQVIARLELEVHVPGGINDEVRRIVEENCRTLRFRSAGFEAE